MFRVIAILAVIFATPSYAEITPRDMRQLAYDNDFAGMETTFADLHQQSLDGEITYDDLRSLVSGLLVTHPDVLDFSKQWIADYPNSPYANAVRAFQVYQQSFDLRGNEAWARTPTRAQEAFVTLQDMAMTLALAGFEAAPDSIPASDAVFRINRSTHWIDDAGLDDLRTQVLGRSHDVGSLKRSLDSADINWGGGGAQEIYRVCDAFAGMITDLENYDPIACTIHMIHAGTVEPEAELWSYEALGDRTDDFLFLARTNRALEAARIAERTEGPMRDDNQSDRDLILSYFEANNVLDVYMVDSFRRLFVHDSESDAVLVALSDRSLAWNAEALKADPLNVRYMDALTREDAVIVPDGVGRVPMDMAQRKVFAVRRAIAQPFHRESWVTLRSQLTDRPEVGYAARADAIYGNAIAYTDNAVRDVIAMLRYKLSVDDAYQRALLRTPDFQVISEAEVLTDITCPIVRLERLLAVQCKIEDNCDTMTVDDAPHLAQILNKVRADNTCQTERNASIDDLYFVPVIVGFDEAFVGIESRE